MVLVRESYCLWMTKATYLAIVLIWDSVIVGGIGHGARRQVLMSGSHVCGLQRVSV